MDKPFRLGVVLGRFQHLHSGHIKMINAGLGTCRQLILIVGSSQESGTRRNPFNLKTRMDIIRHHFSVQIANGTLLLAHVDDMTHEGDGSYEWGDFLLSKMEMWRQHYGINQHIDCMIYGDDEERVSWFRADKVEYINQVLIGRPDHEISATSMRYYLLNDNYEAWKKEMPRPMKFDSIGNKHWFNRLRSELLDVKHYGELVEE